MRCRMGDLSWWTPRQERLHERVAPGSEAVEAVMARLNHCCKQPQGRCDPRRTAPVTMRGPPVGCKTTDWWFSCHTDSQTCATRPTPWRWRGPVCFGSGRPQLPKSLSFSSSTTKPQSPRIGREEMLHLYRTHPRVWGIRELSSACTGLVWREQTGSTNCHSQCETGKVGLVPPAKAA